MRIADLTTEELRDLLAKNARSAALVPIGSTEPHGPHLPLATDVIISRAAAERALPLLRDRGVMALVCPEVPYGVTDFAEGFAGAISVPAAALTAYLRAIAESLLAAGFSHVSLVNNHLEPAHDAAVRAAIEGLGAKASVACPLTRRWARTLSDEFKSGACHAGRYETSIVLAATPDLVDEAAASELADVPISLSDGIKAGKATFREMGIERAYAGSPRSATREEGEATLDRLAEMIASEITEALFGSREH